MFSSLVIEIMVEFITQRLGGLQFNRFVQSFRWICGGKGAKPMCRIPFQVFQSLDISDEDSKRIIQLIICEHWCAIKLCCHLKGWQSEMMLHLIIAVYILVNQFGLTLLTRWHKCLWWWFIRQLKGQQDENLRPKKALLQRFSTFVLCCTISRGPSIWSTTRINGWWNHYQLQFFRLGGQMWQIPLRGSGWIRGLSWVWKSRSSSCLSESPAAVGCIMFQVLLRVAGVRKSCKTLLHEPLEIPIQLVEENW